MKAKIYKTGQNELIGLEGSGPYPVRDASLYDALTLAGLTPDDEGAIHCDLAPDNGGPALVLKRRAPKLYETATGEVVRLSLGMLRRVGALKSDLAVTQSER